MYKRSNVARLCVVLAFAVTGCGEGINGGPAIELNMINTVASSRSAATFLAPGSQPKEFLSLGWMPFYASTSTATSTTTTTTTTYIGSSGVAQLKSLKYYIMEVKVCNSLSISGTAYSNPQGCIYLYHHSVSTKCLNDPKATKEECPERSGDEELAKYRSYTTEEATADTDENHYVDMVAIDQVRAKLNRAVAAQPGEYNYGVISWFRPVKVNAEVTLGNNTTLATKGDLTEKNSNPASTAEDAQFYMNTDTLVGAAGSSKEAVVMMNNGGAFFKFQSPLKYDGQSKLALDLVFNPDALIKGSSSASNFAIRTDAGNAIDIPLLQLTPVVHKDTETAMKETYLITGARGVVRAELYYVKEDTTKAVYGVDLRSINTVSTGSAINDPSAVLTYRENADGTVEFLDYQGASMFPGFKRLSKVGATGTLTLACTHYSLKGLCVDESSGTATATDTKVSYEMTGISTVR